ncbi:MAG: YHS domain-containing protein [Kangiellaceae bacterium]|nr:YHS domain-containing protein [Kangiellaceae bacterium]MCW9000811.1 YHS domain-containing protein [Kangiellaceae bacterium]MCW9018178.1 YHS domain-containing protein [Kangiellaceae bacterium]
MLTRLIIVSLGLLLTACTSLGNAPIYQDEGVAIEGFDTVAYFEQDKAVKGNRNFSYSYKGSIWNFSSEENRTKFINNPDKFAPEYGGYCAYAMSKGLVVSSDPEAYTLHDGKLYLNYSFSVRNTWRKDIPAYLAKSEINWQEKIADVEANFKE